MKKILLLLAVACFCLPAFAQTLVEGYIVKNSGDTLRGFIRERVDWYQPYVEFSSKGPAELESIPLAEINSFYLKQYDTYYYARILEVDKKPVATTRLESAPARLLVKDTIALRLLVKGAVNFYDYTDENFKQHFFVQKNNGNIEELAFVRYLARNGQVAEMPYFIEPLKQTLGDCDKVNENLIRYDEKSLIKVIRQYNSCFEQTSQYQAPGNHPTIGFGVFGGFGLTQMDYKGSSLNPITIDAGSAKFGSTTSATGGVRMDFIPSRKAVRFIPALEIMFQKTGVSKAKIIQGQTEQDYKMSFTFINVGLSIKYMLLKGDGINLYLKAGVYGADIINGTSTYTKTDFLLKSTTKPADFAVYKSWGLAYAGGAGVSFKRLWFELNYNKNISPAKSTSANGLCTNFYAIAGVRISKN